MENSSKEIILDALIELLEEKEFKKDFVKKLNDSVDIPIINEKTEKKVIESLYKLMVNQVKTAVDKIQKSD